MIRMVNTIIDDIKDKVEGMPSLKKEQIDSVMKEFGEVEDLVHMDEGAAFEITRICALVRSIVNVPVGGEEATILKEILAQLKVLATLGVAFKQYFESQRKR